MPHYVLNIATLLREYPQYSNLSGYLEVHNSVFYSPTVSFGANIDLALEFSNKFQDFEIDRPTAPQNVTIAFGISNRGLPVGGWGIGQPYWSGDNNNGTAGQFIRIPSWVYDPDGPSSEIVLLGSAPEIFGVFRTLFQPSTIDILSNSGNLSIDLQRVRNNQGSKDVASYFNTSQVIANIHSNSGTLSLANMPIFNFETDQPHTINILGNTGTMNFDSPELPTSVPPTRGAVINVMASTGTINVAPTEFGILQVNFGAGGSLADIRGTATIGVFGIINLTVDDHQNPAAGRSWSVETTRVAVGELNIVYGGSAGFFGALEIRPNSGSTVNFSSQSLINNSTIIGTGGGNTLIGPLLAGGQTWRIDGLDSGTMRLPNFKLLRWVNMQTLVGNDSDDTFQFTGGSVSGSLDGGIGHNTLFYNPPPTPFVVDLANGIAPLVGGSVSNVQSVITDTTGLPTLSINNVALAEGNTGTTKLVFAVTLSSNPTAPVLVTVNTVDGTATLADNDYQAITNLVLAFNLGGPLTQSVTVLINGDSQSEPNENLSVLLSGATGATIASGQGTATVLNDDVDIPPAPAPTLQIAGPEAGVRAQSLSFSFTVNVQGAVAGFAAGAAAVANAASAFSIVIDWGDGQKQTIVQAAGAAPQSLAHAYSTAGAFTITASAADEFGQESQAATYQVSITAMRLMPAIRN